MLTERFELIQADAMEFDKLYKKSRLPVMTSKERKRTQILIVDSDSSLRHSMRQALQSMGYPNISDASDHALALNKLEERPFSHVIFEAKHTNMPSRDFLLSALELDEQTVFLPSSYDPTVDDVFNLLTTGARGFIVKPFNAEALDYSIVMATKGEGISEAILYAKDRNEALAALVLSSLDKLAKIKRQSRTFATAQRDLPARELAFRRSVEIAKTFSKGGPPALVRTLMELAIERSNGPASRLGRSRRRIEKRKKALKSDPESTISEPI